ncbi:MAG TPA: hypothetical protein DCX07_09910 [Phycisphaerales bacterium]|nr:hypothetical protein [Phycisphaerales bacterium]
MPILHVTDLFNPPGDPDDHFDLVAVCALREIPIAGVVIDHTVERGVPGLATVAKAAELFGRTGRIPSAAGLKQPLRSPTDTGEDQPAEDQGGVEMILSALDSCADGGMVVTIVGSLRDLAAAYNRDPALLKAKIARVMVNAGDSSGVVGPKDWNTNLDSPSWRRIMTSDLPIDWFPCNPSKGRAPFNGYVTYWRLPQNELLRDAPPAVREFFDSEGIPPDSPEPRHLWSTASFLEAARLLGHRPPSPDRPDAWEMLPVDIELDESGTVRWQLRETGGVPLRRIFHVRDVQGYAAQMFEFLHGQFRRARGTRTD